MGGGGSSTPTQQALNYDPAQIAAFQQTQGAQNWTPQQIQSLGTGFAAYQQGATTPYSYSYYGGPAGSIDPGLVSAFETWQQGNAQTEQNWTNYQELVNANEGGEGDNTITVGSGQSQRTAALGSLANPNTPTTPSVGLGQMGASPTPNLVKNGQPVTAGGSK